MAKKVTQTWSLLILKLLFTTGTRSGLGFFKEKVSGSAATMVCRSNSQISEIKNLSIKLNFFKQRNYMKVVLYGKDFRKFQKKLICLFGIKFILTFIEVFKSILNQKLLWFVRSPLRNRVQAIFITTQLGFEPKALVIQVPFLDHSSNPYVKWTVRNKWNAKNLGYGILS